MLLLSLRFIFFVTYCYVIVPQLLNVFNVLDSCSESSGNQN